MERSGIGVERLVGNTHMLAVITHLTVENHIFWVGFATTLPIHFTAAMYRFRFSRMDNGN
jgi:hypothetical protein